MSDLSDKEVLFGLALLVLLLGAGAASASEADVSDQTSDGPDTDSPAAAGYAPSSGLLPSPFPANVRLPLTRSPHGDMGARRPVDTSQPFTNWHQGVDLDAPAGSPIVALGDGLIIPVNPGVGGIVVKLQLDEGGLFVIYADLGAALVSPGLRVAQGDTIGTVRPNGFVHLAIRVSQYGKYIDPATVGIQYQPDSPNAARGA